MRCNTDGKIRSVFDNSVAALMFNEMARVLIVVTGSEIQISEDRVTKGLAEAKKVLRRIADPTPCNFDLNDLFDNATKDIKWFYEKREYYKNSFLSQEETRKLWLWMGKENVQETMEDKIVFLEILIKTIEELESERKKTRSGEVLFLMELFVAFWELLTYNRDTTAHYVSVVL